jgi:hypothetical protein
MARRPGGKVAPEQGKRATCGSSVTVSCQRLPPDMAHPDRLRMGAVQGKRAACGSFVALPLQRLPLDVGGLGVSGWGGG